MPHGSFDWLPPWKPEPDDDPPNEFLQLLREGVIAAIVIIILFVIIAYMSHGNPNFPPGYPWR